MNHLFKGLSLLFVLFLLWKCGEPTLPIVFTTAQTERLLGSENEKTWERIKIVNKKKEPVECGASTWIFYSKKDSISVVHAVGTHCDLEPAYVFAKYVIQNRENMNYLKFYKYGITKEDTILKDTITRRITSITDKEFTTEVNLASGSYIETFQSK